MSNPSNYRTLLNFVGRYEGGYNPGRGDDPETIFGVTIDNFPRLLEGVSTQGLSPVMSRYVRDIQTSTGVDQVMATQQMMRYVGRMLDPMGKATTHPEDGKPRVTNVSYTPGLDAWQKKDIADLRILAEQGLYEKYIVAEGFVFDSETPKKNFRQEVIPYLVDYGINAGPANARAAMSYAIRATGLGNRNIPSVSPEETRAPGFFSNDPRGQMFASRSYNNELIKALANASPEQLEAVAAHFNDWRSRNNQYVEGRQEGLQRRTAELDQFAKTAWLDTDPIGTIITQQAPPAPVSNDPIGEIIQTGSFQMPIKVQYVINGPFAAVAFEFPEGGYFPPGVLIYEIDPKTMAIKDKAPQRVPPGAEFSQRGGVGIEIGDQEVWPVTPPGTLMWKTKGEYNFYAFDSDVNRANAWVGTPEILGSRMALYSQRFFELTPDGRHLTGKNTDLAFVDPSTGSLTIRDTRNNEEIVVTPPRIGKTGSVQMADLTTGRH